MPSESKLSDLFHVNRNTVRQAISDLVTKGLVQKKNGVGSFVTARSISPVKYTLQNISSFTDDMTRMGITPKTKPIRQSVIEAPPEVAEKLMLGKENRVILTERLRLGNNIPLVIERSYLPHQEYKADPEDAFDGVPLPSPDEKISGGPPSVHSDLSRHCPHWKGCQAPGPPFGIPRDFSREHHLRFEEYPVEVLHAFHRGDQYVFEVESGRYRFDLRGLKKALTKLFF